MAGATSKQPSKPSQIGRSRQGTGLHRRISVLAQLNTTSTVASASRWIIAQA
jgi:hypothetical protein